jgi:hypothetical protein
VVRDVFKILKDLEMKAVGVDPNNQKMQEGYFISFRTIGLPIDAQDFEDPYSPTGGNTKADIPQTGADPSTAPKTASGTFDPNKAFAAAIGKNIQNYLNTFLLVDDKLQMNNVYAVMPGTSKVSDTWWAVITGANGIPTDSVISSNLQAAYDAARAVLMNADGTQTAKYAAYSDFEEKYKSKVKALNKSYADALTDPTKLEAFPVTGVTYQDDVHEAMQNWVALGFKEEIEKAIDTLAAQGIDPSIALIVRARQKYYDALNEIPGVGELPYTLMIPNTWFDPNNDDGWTQYGSTDYNSETNYTASSTSYGGGAGFSVGFFSAGADYEHSDQHTDLQWHTDDLEIQFEYAAVDIERPWLDTSLLNLQNWFLMGDYKKGCISAGTMSQEKPQDAGLEPTFLPSIPTSLVLIRNLKIKWGTMDGDWNTFSSSDEGGATVGWGPFAVSANYSHREEKRHFEAHIDGEWLAVDGVQLIGYVSMIMPVSPGKDSAPYLQKATAAKG